MARGEVDRARREACRAALVPGPAGPGDDSAVAAARLYTAAAASGDPGSADSSAETAAWATSASRSAEDSSEAGCGRCCSSGTVGAVPLYRLGGAAPPSPAAAEEEEEEGCPEEAMVHAIEKLAPGAAEGSRAWASAATAAEARPYCGR